MRVERGAARSPGSPHDPITIGALADVDALTSNTFVMFCANDVRPLQGAAGWIDWRLCGALSHAIEAGSFVGERGEVMLMPFRGRLGRRRLFVFGIGAAAAADAACLGDVCRAALEVLRRARVDDAVFVAPRGPDEALQGRFVSALRAECAPGEEPVTAVLIEG